MEKVIDKLRKEIEQTKKEADAVLESCKMQLSQLDKLTEKPSRIRVPENIKFEERIDRFAIVSPNGKCRLFAMDIPGGIPGVGEAGSREDMTEDIIRYPLYLEPCKREDLKCGDVAYVCEEKIEAYDLTGEIESYLVVLNNTHCVCLSDDSDMLNDNHDYDYWYNVVR